MEVADNFSTSPSLFLPHSLPKLSQRAKIWKWSSSFSCYIVYLVLCASQVCCRGGLPLYLYTKERWCYGHSWHEAHAPPPSAWRHATATWRRGRAAPGGGRPTPGGSRPLTGSHHHYLRMVDWWVLLNCSLGGILLIYLKLMDLYIYSLHNSALESAFWCILPCICVYVLQKH